MTFTVFLSVVLMSEIAQILSLCSGGFLSLKVNQLNGFALKLAIYTYKKNQKYSHNNCVSHCPVTVVSLVLFYFPETKSERDNVRLFQLQPLLSLHL